MLSIWTNRVFPQLSVEEITMTPLYELKKVSNKFLGSFKKKNWGSKPLKFKETRGSWKTLTSLKFCPLAESSSVKISYTL